MVFSHGGSNPGDGLDEYYASMQPQWAALDTVRWIQMSLDRHLLIILAYSHLTPVLAILILPQQLSRLVPS